MGSCAVSHCIQCPAIRLSSLLVDPSHSLIRQHAHSRERAEPLNGFGVGWYANVAISNRRESAICRYAADTHPESLYIYSGRLYPTENSNSDKSPAIAVSSEQLTQDSGWKGVPINHMVLISGSYAAKIVPIGQ